MKAFLFAALFFAPSVFAGNLCGSTRPSYVTVTGEQATQLWNGAMDAKPSMEESTTLRRYSGIVTYLGKQRLMYCYFSESVDILEKCKIEFPAEEGCE